MLLGLVVQVVLAAAGGPVRAQEERPRVAILELEIGGTAPPELRPQLDASLAGGLYAAGYEVVKRTDVAQKLRGAPELVGCRTTTCLARVAELVGAPLFVVARVEASGAAYTFELELLDPEASSVTINRIERSCPVCTIGEANEVMSTAAAQLRGEAPATVKVRIATTPPGGQVVVDGAPVGTAPLELDLTAGEHTLSAALGDQTSGETRVTVAMPEDGTAQEVALELRGPPAPPPPPPPPAPGAR